MLRTLAHLSQCGLQALQLSPGVGFLQEINVFFREVQRGLHQHAQVDQCIAQCVNLVRKRAGQRPAGAARCSLGAGVDQVSNRLGLGQVDLVVQKCPLGELAWLRHAQPRQHRACARGALRCFQAARQQQLKHHRPAMGLQLQHVLTGVGVGCREVQGQPLVYGLALRITKRQVGGLARA